MLRVARAVGRARPVHVVTTHLAAHAIPPEYKGRADAYIDEVAIPSLHAAHAEGLVDAVDAFCEGIAFSPPQVERPAYPPCLGQMTRTRPASPMHLRPPSELHPHQQSAPYSPAARPWLSRCRRVKHSPCRPA